MEHLTIQDLKPAEYNPRAIDDLSKMGLKYSLKEFGDISGITWNRRTGNLVTGHQRLDNLKEIHGQALKVVETDNPEVGYIEIGDGTGGRFSLRIVDWPIEKEILANLSANNPGLSGFFTEAAREMIEQINNDDPEASDRLVLERILGEIEDEDEEGVGHGKKAKFEDTAGLELHPYEHYDYLVILADNAVDFAWLCEFFDIKRVDGSQLPGVKKVGLGRAVPARKAIERIKNGNRTRL